MVQSEIMSTVNKEVLPPQCWPLDATTGTAGSKPRATGGGLNKSIAGNVKSKRHAEAKAGGSKGSKGSKSKAKDNLDSDKKGDIVKKGKVFKKPSAKKKN